ncbi:MAG: FG-GAP repeat domain-containing protein [Polyangiales bacterium]
MSSEWPPSSPRGAALATRLQECVGPETGGDPRALLLRVEGASLVAELKVRRGYSWLWRFFGFSSELEPVRVALDAELRTYVAQRPALRRGAVVARALALPGRGYTGIASHDGLVLLAGARELRTMRYAVRRGRPVLVRDERLVVPPPPHGRRDAFSRASDGVFWQRGQVLQQVRLSPLRVEAASSPCEEGAFPLADACAHWALGRDYFDSRLATRASSVPPERAPTSFYARSRRIVRRSDGSADPVEVVVSPRGRIVARTGSRTVGVAGYGAGLAAADVDQDGSLEVFASLDSPVGEGDRLHIIRVRPDGSLIRIWMSEPVAGSILLATSADLDGDGFEEFLAVEEVEGENARLWIVR